MQDNIVATCQSHIILVDINASVTAIPWVSYNVGWGQKLNMPALVQYRTTSFLAIKLPVILCSYNIKI